MTSLHSVPTPCDVSLARQISRMEMVAFQTGSALKRALDLGKADIEDANQVHLECLAILATLRGHKKVCDDPALQHGAIAGLLLDDHLVVRIDYRNTHRELAVGNPTRIRSNPLVCRTVADDLFFALREVILDGFTAPDVSTNSPSMDTSPATSIPRVHVRSIR